MAGAERPSITAQILNRAPRPPLIFACILLVVALFLGYIGGAVLDSSHFAHRASDALDDPAVQSEVSNAVSDTISGSSGGAVSAGQVGGTVDSVIADPKFQKDFRVQVAKVHSSLVNGDADSATLQLKTLGPLVAKKLGLPAGVSVPPVGLEVKPPSGVLSIVRALDSLSWLPGALGLAALAFLSWLLFRAVDRADAVRSVAKTMLVAGVLMVIVYFAARLLITSAAGGTGAVNAIVDAYFGDFAFASLILAGAGVLGWIGASRFAAAPATKRAPKPAPAPEPVPPPKAAPRGRPAVRQTDERSEASTRVISQPARVDLPTVRDDSPPPGAGSEPAKSSTKTCPDCAETVLAAARVCKHCGYRFQQAP